MKKYIIILLAFTQISTAANFQFQFSGGFNDNSPRTPVGGNPGTTLGEQRQNLFNRAAQVWGNRIESNVTIVVNAEFASLFCSPNSVTLGSAGPLAVPNFPGIPIANTWYPLSLVDAIRGINNNPGVQDISATFNSNVDTGCFNGGTFYYGLDGNTPGNQVDLYSTVLHELGHGLGFVSFVDVGNGVDPATGEFNSGFPAIFDRFIFDTEANMPWTSMNDTQRLASMSNDPNLVWNGANVTNDAGDFINSGFNSGLVRLFAPVSVQPGSSVSHFTTAATPDVLMEPILGDLGFSQVDLTPLLFKDLGYTLTPDLIFENGFE